MAPTQDALYRRIDLDLSWSERELPERMRTKHVHRLHPYLGKFIPQLVEELFRRHVPGGGRVLDPFAGSGTTLVQALESGLDATGIDIAVHGSRYDASDPARWWRSRVDVRFVASELPRFVLYRLGLGA